MPPFLKKKAYFAKIEVSPWGIGYEVLLLRITRQTVIKYFKFQMVMAAAKILFGTFSITMGYLSCSRIIAYSYI